MPYIERTLTWIENTLAAASLAAAAVIAMAAVIRRFVFGGGIFWSEEAIIFLIIFSTFVGAAIALRHDEHVNVDIFPVYLRERGEWFFRLLGSSLILIYCAVVGGYGWLLITLPPARATITPALNLPLWMVEIALPIGLTLLLIRSLQLVYRTARGHQTFPEAEKSVIEEEVPEEASVPSLEELSEEPEEKSKQEEGGADR